MRLGAVGHLIAHPRRQMEHAAVLELRLQLALDAEENVTFAAPVIGAISGRVLDEPDTQRPVRLHAPERDAGLTRMLRRRDR